MNLPSLAAVLLATSVAVAIGPAQAQQRRPNVVLIMSDDQGWTDYGFMGHDVIRTPALDALARRSLLLERGYVVAPLCRPSLASIATGLYPHQHGVCANDVVPARGAARQQANRPVFERFHQQPSLIKLLTAHGYLAFQSGKWWEGSWQDGGFTAGLTHGDATRGGRHGDEGLAIGREGLEPIRRFIDRAQAEDKPLFVWYAPFLPHTPHNPPAEILQKYEVVGRPANVAKYYAMCEWFDQTCGELLALLEERRLSEETIVAYVCDNGWSPFRPSAEGNPPDWPMDYAPRSKGSPFEMGIRTPIMISWPRRIAAERSGALASSIDLMPTILSACGIETPPDLPGIDLLDEDALAQRDAVFGVCHSTHNMNPDDLPSTLQYRWCVSGDFKLLLRSDGADTTRYRALHEWDREPVRLYNVREDPHEQRNIAADHPELVRQLTEKIERELRGARSGSM